MMLHPLCGPAMLTTTTALAALAASIHKKRRYRPSRMTIVRPSDAHQDNGIGQLHGGTGAASASVPVFTASSSGSKVFQPEGDAQCQRWNAARVYGKVVI